MPKPLEKIVNACDRTLKWLITAAGLAALLPLYQFWAETDAREIDRISNQVSAFSICAETLTRVASGAGQSTPEFETMLVQPCNRLVQTVLGKKVE